MLTAVERFYARTLDWALAHRVFMLLITLLTIVLTVRMYGLVPKGFMPQQDTGIIMGSTLADPDVSFQTMEDRQRQAVDVLLADPGGRHASPPPSASRPAGRRSTAGS